MTRGVSRFLVTAVAVLAAAAGAVTAAPGKALAGAVGAAEATATTTTGTSTSVVGPTGTTTTSGTSTTGSTSTTATTSTTSTTGTSAAAAPAGAVYVPLMPMRVLDTRSGVGASKQAVGAHQSVTLKLSGATPVPFTAQAVVVNVTVAGPVSAGWVSVGPAVTTDSAAVNFGAGRTVAALAVPRLSSSGSITFYNGSSGAVQLVADLEGYYGPVSYGLRFTPVSTVRVLDTRTGTGVANGSVASHGSVTLKVNGTTSVPASASAVVLNLTVAAPAGSGWVSVGAAATTASSNLNFVTGQGVSNLVVTRLSAAGTITLYNGSGAAVQLVADLQGYYAGLGNATAYSALAPVRVLDSSAGVGVSAKAVGAGQSVTVPVAGATTVPTGALAVVATVTAASPAAAGWLSVGPAETTSSSNLNYVAGRTTTNLAVSRLSSSGTITVHNGSAGTVQVIVDVQGYLTRAAACSGTCTVWAWAFGNYAGELGPGGPHRGRAVQVGGLTNIIAVASGLETGYALRGDGTAWAWGAGEDAELGNGTWADSATPVRVGNLTSVVAIAATQTNGFALRSNGTVWSWGRQDWWALGNDTLVDAPKPVQVKGLTDVIAIAGGAGETCYVLRADGSLWAWGDGELANGTDGASAVPIRISRLDNVTAAVGGLYNGYALRSDGIVLAWGSGLGGRLGNGSTTDHLVPVQVSGLTRVTAIGAGENNAYAVRSDGTIWAWGIGDRGALGNGTETTSLIPVQVSGLAGATSVASETDTGYALRSDGTVWGWGYEADEPGPNRQLISDLPVQVAGLTHITAIAAGGFVTYVLMDSP